MNHGRHSWFSAKQIITIFSFFQPSRRMYYKREWRTSIWFRNETIILRPVLISTNDKLKWNIFLSAFRNETFLLFDWIFEWIMRTWLTRFAVTFVCIYISCQTFTTSIVILLTLYKIYFVFTKDIFIFLYHVKLIKSTSSCLNGNDRTFIFHQPVALFYRNIERSQMTSCHCTFFRTHQ